MSAGGFGDRTAAAGQGGRREPVTAADAETADGGLCGGIAVRARHSGPPRVRYPVPGCGDPGSSRRRSPAPPRRVATSCYRSETSPARTTRCDAGSMTGQRRLATAGLVALAVLAGCTAHDAVPPAPTGAAPT